MITAQYTTPAYMGQRILVVKTNGGKVVLEKKLGNDWIVSDTITADGAYQLQLGASVTRITPSNGAVCELGE